MSLMNVTVDTPKNSGRLSIARRNVLIAKMYDLLTQGYMTTHALSKALEVNRITVDKYRPLVDELIGKQTVDRNTIRNLQLKRTYTIIEMLMNDLKTCSTIKEKTLIYNQIAKFSQHLALITGLNIETHVNVDHQSLVIIRANNDKQPTIDITPEEPSKQLS